MFWEDQPALIELKISAILVKYNPTFEGVFHGRKSFIKLKEIKVRKKLIVALEYTFLVKIC